jgi:hypothetical protein
MKTKKELPVKVWTLNDDQWVAAKTKKTAIEYFVEYFVEEGCQEADFVAGMVHALTDTDLREHKFYDGRSFASELASQLKKGTKLPFLLATTGWRLITKE